MKKSIFVVLIVCLIGAVLCACQPKTTEPTSPISYRQTALYYGKTPNFSARLATGEGEAMFVADGVVSDVQPFVTLTLVPQHVDLFNDNYTYTLTGDKGETAGELQKDSFGASYTAAVPNWEAVGVPHTLTVTSGQVQDTITLENKTQGSITADQAKEVATNAIQERLNADNAPREIYIKFINDTADEASPYYWYVAFIASPTDYYAVLVDGQGNVLSVNP